MVLAFGHSEPLKVLGVMIAAAMMAAALTTFIVIPVVAGLRTYVNEPNPLPTPEAELATGALAPLAQRRPGG